MADIEEEEEGEEREIPLVPAAAPGILPYQFEPVLHLLGPSQLPLVNFTLDVHNLLKFGSLGNE